MLRRHGLRPGEDVTVQRFDVGVGLHGDHIGGERDAARALAAGRVDAACMIDSNLLLFGQEGVLAPDVNVVARTGAYDHCTMTAGPGAGHAELACFGELLLGMSYADAEVRVLLDLEGLKQWQPPRLAGYAQIEEAVDASGFYDEAGGIGAGDYRP